MAIKKIPCKCHKCGKDYEIGKSKKCPHCNHEPLPGVKTVHTDGQWFFRCQECANTSRSPAVIGDCQYFHKYLQPILETLEFEITENHLKLLKRFNVKYDRFNEYGAPFIDPKRPYGNSNVDDDVAKIIGVQGEIIEEEDGETYYILSEQQQRDMLRLHVETTIALEICLVRQSFETGVFVRERPWYSGGWKKKTDENKEEIA
jgi:hypothetical protein